MQEERIDAGPIPVYFDVMSSSPMACFYNAGEKRKRCHCCEAEMHGGFKVSGKRQIAASQNVSELVIETACLPEDFSVMYPSQAGDRNACVDAFGSFLQCRSSCPSSNPYGGFSPLPTWVTDHLPAPIESCEFQPRSLGLHLGRGARLPR
jgi:hypothetical protein